MEFKNIEQNHISSDLTGELDEIDFCCLSTQSLNEMKNITNQTSSSFLKTEL